MLDTANCPNFFFNAQAILLCQKYYPLPAPWMSNVSSCSQWGKHQKMFEICHNSFWRTIVLWEHNSCDWSIFFLVCLLEIGKILQEKICLNDTCVCLWVLSGSCFGLKWNSFILSISLHCLQTTNRTVLREAVQGKSLFNLSSKTFSFFAVFWEQKQLQVYFKDLVCHFLWL